MKKHDFVIFIIHILQQNLVVKCTFLPRCMQCRGGLAMRKLYVRLSVKRVNCDKTEERSAQISTRYEKPFSLVL